MPDNTEQVKLIPDNPKRTKQPVVVPVDAGYQAYIDYITERGLSLEQATSNGLLPAFHSDPRALSIATVKHHWETTKKQLPGMLVDYGDESYSFRYICADKDLPTDKDDRPIKMPSPNGSGSRLFLPKCVDWDALPSGTRVRICESALKAVCCAVRGEPSIGLNGVSGWSKSNRISPKLADLFKTRGWVPVITFDANAHEGPEFNPLVARSQSALVSALYNVCDVDEVLIVRMPYDGPYDAGVDDYIAKGGTMERLHSLTYSVDADGTPSVASYDFDTFLSQNFALPNSIVEGYISRGECNLLTSAPKAGKTRIAITAALQIAAGNGDMLGIPGFTCHKSKVMLFVMEDGGHQLQGNLKHFMEDLGISKEDIKDTFQIVQTISERSDILVKLDTSLRRGFKPDLVIIDNITSLDMIEQKQDPQGKLTVREYQKIKRFSSWAQDNNVAMILLAHSKKGAGNANNISDKTNSTGTMAGAVDNLAALERFNEKKEIGEDQRRFLTQARHYKGVDVVLNIGEGAVAFVGDMWDYSSTEVETQILFVVKRLSEAKKRRHPKDEPWVAVKDIVAEMGKGGEQTRRNQCSTLVNKGWLDSHVGVNGGYKLSERAAKALDSKF